MTDNLRLVKYLDGSAEIAWDGSLFQGQIFRIKALSYSTGLWVVLSQTPHTSTIVTGPYAAVQVALVDNNVEIDLTNILTLSLRNASDIHDGVLIGQDESGQKRFLVTTPEGVLKVTGANITNTGGDASAGNQLTQISQANTAVGALNESLIKLGAILAKLDSVGIKAGSISALANVSINNIPGNFPDTATTAAINSLAGIAAKNSDLHNLIAKTELLLKASDVLTDAQGNLKVIIENLPSDYPDLAVKHVLMTLSTSVDSSKAVLDTICASISLANSELQLQTTKLAESFNVLGLSKSRLDAILGEIAGLSPEIQAVKDSSAVIETGILSLVSNTSDLTKKSDLYLDGSKNLGVIVANFPNNYPNSQANTELLSIKNLLSLINQGLDVRLSEALPSGSNNIGSVGVSALPLAEDAAKDSTLNIIGSLTTAIYEVMKSLQQILDTIQSHTMGLSSIISQTQAGREIIFDVAISFDKTRQVRFNDVVSDASKLGKFNHYDVLVINFGAGFEAKFMLDSHFNGQPISNSLAAKSINAAGSGIFSFTIPLNAVSIIFDTYSANSGGARVLVYGRDR